VAVGEGPTFPLLLRGADAVERPVQWESVTGETPAVGDEITVEGEPWQVVEDRGGVFVCEPLLTPR
jgi:hypothetical protein